MAAFNEAIGIVLRNEGGYSNDPADAGGETKYGISKRSYPELDIAQLTPGDAIDIYKQNYWDTHPQLSRIESQAVANKTFDLMVNMGPSSGVRILQRSINRIYTGARPLAVDGRLGPLTVARANALNAQALLDTIRETAADHYRAIVRARPGQAKFLKGWLRRANQ